MNWLIVSGVQLSGKQFAEIAGEVSLIAIAVYRRGEIWCMLVAIDRQDVSECLLGSEGQHFSINDLERQFRKVIIRHRCTVASGAG